MAIINLQGAVYLDNIINPFDSIDEEIEKVKNDGANIIIVDFHAEATGEKKGMGFYLDGKVSAVFGTHTHTQTADEQILPNGTGYITDIGMTGPYYSVLGVTPEVAIQKMKTNLPVRFTNPDGPCTMEGVVIEIDDRTGKTNPYRKVQKMTKKGSGSTLRICRNRRLCLPVAKAKCPNSTSLFCKQPHRLRRTPTILKSVTASRTRSIRLKPQR